MPLPGRLGVRPAVGVVGREAEMATMSDAFKRVAGGEGREVLLVSGEAGLGKTTLVAETARAAFDAGACVLFGHCEEDLATPYQLFAEALGHYVTHAPEDQLVAHVDAHGSELARLVPALGEPAARARRRRRRPMPTPSATCSSRRSSGCWPWRPSISRSCSCSTTCSGRTRRACSCLRHLIAAEQPLRVLVLGTYRDSELSRSHPFLETLAALRRQHGVDAHRADRARRHRCASR